MSSTTTDQPLPPTTPPPSFHRSRPRRDTTSSFPFALSFSSANELDTDNNNKDEDRDLPESSTAGGGGGGRYRSLSTASSNLLSLSSTPPLSVTSFSPSSGSGLSNLTRSPQVQTPESGIRRGGGLGEGEDEYGVIARGEFGMKRRYSLWSWNQDDEDHQGEDVVEVVDQSAVPPDEGIEEGNDQDWSGGMGLGYQNKGKGKQPMRGIELGAAFEIDNTTVKKQTESVEETELPPNDEPKEIPSLESSTYLTPLGSPIIDSSRPFSPPSGLGRSLARSRAQSIAFSTNIPTTSTITSTSTSRAPSTRGSSPAGSLFREGGRMRELKGKLMGRRRSSLVGNLSGGERDDEGRVMGGDQASSSLIEKEKDRDKGKMKTLVRKYIRSKSSLSSTPVIDPSSSTSASIELIDGGEIGTLRLTPSRVKAARPRLSMNQADHQRGITYDAVELWKPIYGPEMDSSNNGDMIARSVSEPVVPKGIPYFDVILPRELKVRVFEALIGEYVREHEREVRDGEWRGERAKQRWFGEAAGRREIIKLSRVSREWQAIALDGQLWADANMHDFLHFLPPTGLVRMLRNTSQYTRKLDLYGWNTLPADALRYAMLSFGDKTNLHHLDIQGCGQLDSFTLEQIVMRSPRLRVAKLKGSVAVTERVITALGESCLGIVDLDISHCRRVEPLEGAEFDIPEAWSKLRRLRVAGIAGEGLLGVLAKQSPLLEVLDISYSTEITDDDLKEFVTVPPELLAYRTWREEGPDRDFPITFLRSSVAGQLATTFNCNGLVPRRMTRLRHLNMSSCSQLTDLACKYLTHAAPNLEILELASLPALKDGGLVSLLATCPNLRIIDLEGASDLTNAALAALTPSRNAPLSTGHSLERLSISFATAISNDALMRLVRGCPRLIHLAVDNTAANDTLVKEFIRRRSVSSSLSVIDCRHVSRNVVEAMERFTRPRTGWRGWQAEPLAYQDGKKHKNPRRDECGDLPVVQSFWTWSKLPKVCGIPTCTRSSTSTSDDIATVPQSPDTRGCIIM